VVGIRSSRRGGLDEQALVEAARRDADAFAELYRRHVAAVHAFAYRRSGSRTIADDVTAATFERALRNLHRFEWRPSGIGPWLYRIAANELADHHRRERRRSDREAAAGDPRPHAVAIEPTDPDDDVLAALSALRPRYQEVLTLRYLADLDAAEVAAAVGISRPHLAVLLRRARVALRRALDRGDAR
jgi:RNA polymerase sigma-70 factor (ECF subfamily)